MTEQPPTPPTLLAKGALCLSCAALISFLAGMSIGSLDHHRAGEESGDMIAFTLCRVVGPVFAFSGWVMGLLAVLRRPGCSTWSAVTVTVLIFIFLLLLSYSIWRGTAAFHPNSWIP